MPETEPAAAEPVAATRWSPACPQNTLPGLDELLGDPMPRLARLASLQFLGGIGAGEIEEIGRGVRAQWARFARSGELAGSGAVAPWVLSWKRVR